MIGYKRDLPDPEVGIFVLNEEPHVVANTNCVEEILARPLQRSLGNANLVHVDEVYERESVYAIVQRCGAEGSGGEMDRFRGTAG